ncbi:MAG: hypothetical protein G01um101448_569 [Parcubacteria group bacterium Gr01-1014_48]|nr:MAG: hypothetical protein Greene041614_205 [Parcubacteria group bacterium Greene0416_14]TSC73763.1 MAG: hypothetical protein G01um101448_569 [Parcubacteria group bacterium Gr01-1014_48]TSD01191.1 MAG: hypothetical protein Greene101415_386 [Parcubacteria group bacterium Greene1014_15]TSD08196.1 MAG: hypothetical protein Greene07144_327 [Parcubacteria group bacterium Greene0714_4]
MKKKAALEVFFEKVLEDVGKGDRLVNEKEGIVCELSRQMGKTGVSISQSLAKLSDLGLIERTYSHNSIGRGSRITEIRILKRKYSAPHTQKQETTSVTSASSAEVTEAPLLSPVEEASARAVKTRENGERDLVAVLVDYDNVLGVTRKIFEVSFIKLRNFCREFGRVIYSDIFLSPISARRPEVITLLWQSGFEVFVCPMQTKDKDAVDAKLKARVRKYAEFSSVRKVLIVSGDGDFSHDPDLHAFVQDLGKEVIILKPSEYRHELEGDNHVFKNDALSRRADDFVRCIEYASTGSANVPAEDQKRFSFVQDVIRSIDIVGSGKTLSFNKLSELVWEYLCIRIAVRTQVRWSQFFGEGDLKNVLSALVHTKILNPAVCKGRHGSPKEFTYYELNRGHSIVTRTGKQGTYFYTHTM